MGKNPKYAELTFNDPNLIKRYLQRERLALAKRVIGKDHDFSVLDYGCGNAELYKLLNSGYPGISYTGYDPLDKMLDEARGNIGNPDNAVLTSDHNLTNSDNFDYIFCLEVLEHLTDEGIELVLDEMIAKLKPEGTLVIGVPNEIYLAALIRGLFRMTRRFGWYDANIRNILMATAGHPPKDRPSRGEGPRNTFYTVHTGFDHRHLQRMLDKRLEVASVIAGPFSWLPVFFNTEVNFVCRKKPE